jgi:hypothetical protein
MIVVVVVSMIVIVSVIMVVLALVAGGGRQLAGAGRLAVASGREGEEFGALDQGLAAGFKLGARLGIGGLALEADEVGAGHGQLDGCAVGVDGDVGVRDAMFVCAVGVAFVLAVVMVVVALTVGMGVSGQGKDEGDREGVVATVNRHAGLRMRGGRQAGYTITPRRSAEVWIAYERSALMKVLHRSRPWLDSVGIGLSDLCVVHCVALTLLVVITPGIWLRQQVFGVEVRWLVWAEWAFAAGAVLLALASAYGSWRRHGRAGPLVVLALGIAVLLVGVFSRVHAVPLAGTAVVVAGGGLLIGGHLWSLRLRQADPATRRSDG